MEFVTHILQCCGLQGIYKFPLLYKENIYGDLIRDQEGKYILDKEGMKKGFELAFQNANAKSNGAKGIAERYNTDFCVIATMNDTQLKHPDIGPFYLPLLKEKGFVEIGTWLNPNSRRRVTLFARGLTLTEQKKEEQC